MTAWVLIIAMWRTGLVAIPYPAYELCERAQEVVMKTANFTQKDAFCIPGPAAEVK